MRIALDAMGGDRAPNINIEGAILAARDLGITVVLVGREDVTRRGLGDRASGLPIEVMPASEVIGMDEHPAVAVRRKKDSSIVVGTRLLKEGGADAFVSAGNSGAVMAAALLVLGRCAGIDRPAISTLIPTQRGCTLLLDAGANTDPRPENLVQFARMGSIYMQVAEHRQNPTVGLLSNGEEATKGNDLTLEAHDLLRQSGLNFVGNVEGRDIMRGTTDVVVTDGFTGNIVLKSIEGAASMILDTIRQEITRGVMDKLAAFALRTAFQRAKRRLDPNEIGAAPLLGVNGAVFVAHGSSNERAIRNAVRVAKQAVAENIVSAIGRVGEAEPTAL